MKTYLSLFSALYRAYDPNTARWLSRDPLPDAERSQGPNLYEYVGDDPIIGIDPSGLDTITFNVRGGVLTNDPTGWTGSLHSLSHKVFGTTGPTLVFYQVCPASHPHLVSAVTAGGGMVFDPARGGWTTHLNQPANNDVTVDIQTTTLLHYGWTTQTMNQIEAIIITVSCSSDCKKN